MKNEKFDKKGFVKRLLLITFFLSSLAYLGIKMLPVFSDTVVGNAYKDALIRLVYTGWLMFMIGFNTMSYISAKNNLH